MNISRNTSSGDFERQKALDDDPLNFPRSRPPSRAKARSLISACSTRDCNALDMGHSFGYLLSHNLQSSAGGGHGRVDYCLFLVGRAGGLLLSNVARTESPET